MSEYQYYEFQTVDRPLTEREMSKLRSLSTRASITPTSFVNEYNWGDFKGNPDILMERYFDAFLYLANWGTHVLKLGLSPEIFDIVTALKYCRGDSFSVKKKNSRIILSFVSEDEDREADEWLENEGCLASLIPVRSDLKRGDLRALYLGWLLCSQNGELDDEDEEPPVPAGLGRLNASLARLVDFLRIDRDLIHVAAQTSSPLNNIPIEKDKVLAWIASRPANEKNAVLAGLMADGDHVPASMMLKRYIEEQNGIGSSADAAVAPRTVGTLLRAAKEYAEERQRMETEKRAKAKARREQQAAIVRARYLDELAEREVQLWTEVDTLITMTQPKSYDKAMKILFDLRDLDTRRKGNDFRSRIEKLRQTHARKPAFIKRLQKADL